MKNKFQCKIEWLRKQPLAILEGVLRAYGINPEDLILDKDIEEIEDLWWSGDLLVTVPLATLEEHIEWHKKDVYATEIAKLEAELAMTA